MVTSDSLSFPSSSKLFTDGKSENFRLGGKGIAGWEQKENSKHILRYVMFMREKGVGELIQRRQPQ